MKQVDRLLRHFLDYGEITSLEAQAEYSIMRAGARVFDLRAEGHDIETQIVTGKNRYGEPTHYAKYIYHGRIQ